MEQFVLALGQFSSLWVFVALLVGCVWGTIAGALPGMGTVVALIVALPFTLNMSTETATALFLGIYVTSVYGGFISAILINTPGTPQSAATVLDGYPMARAGKADLAIGWATFASLFGGIFSLAVLIFAAPALARVSVAFGPAAIFAIVIFALTCIAWVSAGSTVKGLLGGMIGLWLTTIGPDGLIASEASNDAVTGGALIPTLALGIPGDGGTVVLLGVLTIKGLTPGSDLINNNPHILIGAFLVILIGNFIMFGLGAFGARVFARLLNLPEPILMGMILMFSLVGSFTVRSNMVDLIVCTVAGVIGVILRLAKYPIAPIVIGMALGRIFEGKLRQGLISARGDFFEFLADPIAIGVLILTTLVIARPVLAGRSQKGGSA